jgi:hypothetical protein
VVQAPEVTDDRRERGGDDRLVQRGQQHAEHEPAEHNAQLPLAERAGPPGIGSVGLGGLSRHGGLGRHAVSFGWRPRRVADR